MKKILILVDKVGPKNTSFVNFLEKNINTENKITIASISDLFFEINQKNIEIYIKNESINNFDLVFFRRVGSILPLYASTLAICLKYLKIKFIDTAWSENASIGNKLTSYIRLSLDGIPTLPIKFVRSSRLNEYKEKIENEFGFPLIAKELATQRGKGVFKINSKEDFKLLKKGQFLFQKFIEIEKEYRILVLGDKVGTWEEKIKNNPEEFRHNVALGAEEKFLPVNEISAEMTNIAIKAAKALNLQVAGVDLCIEKKTGKIFILEVNRGPGLTKDSPEPIALARYLNELIS